MEIRLSSSEFKALASETRASIIKLLKERNHTLTELSRKMHLAVPTVKQHLGILSNADLVEELDEGRKWKYYCLTRKGKNIFMAETPVNILIVLGVTVVALVGMLHSLLSVLGTQAMAFSSDRVKGEAFIGAAENRLAAPALADSASKAAAGSGGAAVDGISQILGQAGSEAVAEGGAQAVGSTTALPIEMQVAVLLFGIVAISLLAGYLIAKAR